MRIYFLFALLFMVPNAVFFVTEPLALPVRIAAFLMPLGVWLILLAAVRKPGKVAWCLLPKLIIDGGQLVALSVFGESVIAVDMLLNLTSSNASEASELLANILRVLSCVFFLYTVPTLWLAYRSVRGRDQLSNAFRKRWAWIGVVIFVIGWGLGKVPVNPYDRLSWRYDVYPLNAVYNIGFALRKAERNSNYAQTSADFRYEATKTMEAADKREIYVLVVGETSRAMEWSLYGYERPTTPCMEATEGLVYFRDAVTQSNNTHKSVPIILSPACAEEYDVLYRTKSIITAFKEAGFHTQQHDLRPVPVALRLRDIFPEGVLSRADPQGQHQALHAASLQVPQMASFQHMLLPRQPSAGHIVQQVGMSVKNHGKLPFTLMPAKCTPPGCPDTCR